MLSAADKRRESGLKNRHIFLVFQEREGERERGINKKFVCCACVCKHRNILAFVRIFLAESFRKTPAPSSFDNFVWKCQNIHSHAHAPAHTKTNTHNEYLCAYVWINIFEMVAKGLKCHRFWGGKNSFQQDIVNLWVWSSNVCNNSMKYGYEVENTHNQDGAIRKMWNCERKRTIQ